MHRFIRIRTADEAATFSTGALGSFDPDLISHHGADEHWVVVDLDGKPSARASLWWRNPPPYKGHRVGVIGHFLAESVESGSLLLEYLARRLREECCTIAIGPMDGNTWRAYRMITHRGDEPEFFLEPNHSETLLHCFVRGGFEPFADYFSALNEDLSFEDRQVANAADRLAKSGIHLRSLDITRFEDELRRIFRVAEISFCANFLYTPISETEFINSYRRLEGMLRPELILIAEQGNEPVGFVFTVPDWAQHQRGRVIDTVIVKTVAVLPERRCAGLGASLVAQTQVAARRLGYRRAIHALMHESNSSRNLSARYARTFRRYSLFARSL